MINILYTNARKGATGKTYPKSLISLVDGAWTMIAGGVDFLEAASATAVLDLLLFILVNFSFILDFVLFEKDFRTLLRRNLPFSDLKKIGLKLLILIISNFALYKLALSIAMSSITTYPRMLFSPDLEGIRSSISSSEV